jgi:ABC-2 type transport system ATP-binding protein
MLLSVMPAYYPRAFFGAGRLAPVDNFTQIHRVFLYISCIVLPFGIYFGLKRRGAAGRRFVLLYISFATLITYSATRTVPAFDNITNIPLHLCNTAMYITPLCLAFRAKRVFYFTYFINVFGAFVAMLIPDYSLHTLFDPGLAIFWVNHACAFAMPLVIVALGEFPRPRLRQFLWSMVGFAAYFLLVLILNAWLSNYGKVDWFFLNGDFVVSKLGDWAKHTRDITAVFGAEGGIRLVFYPLYQSLFFLVYCLLGLAMWFIYENAFMFADGIKEAKIKIEETSEASPLCRALPEPNSHGKQTTEASSLCRAAPMPNGHGMQAPVVKPYKEAKPLEAKPLSGMSKFEFRLFVWKFKLGLFKLRCRLFMFKCSLFLFKLKRALYSHGIQTTHQEVQLHNMTQQDKDTQPHGELNGEATPQNKAQPNTAAQPYEEAKPPQPYKEAKPPLRVLGFSKRYGRSEVYAVRDAWMEIGAGEIFGFLGPNGAGKSTVIKSIVGLQSITEGRIEVCGCDVRRQSVAAKRRIGFVPDHYALYERLTGREYVNYIADLYNVPKSMRDERIKSLTERLQIAGALDEQIRTYSHGMKQKIAITSSLIHNPGVWILDEPLTGLDPNSIYQVKEIMREHARAGNVVFFSSHIMDVAERLCDRIALIRKGKIIADGTVAALLSGGGTLEEYYLKTIAGTDNDTDTNRDTDKDTDTNTDKDKRNGTDGNGDTTAADGGRGD